MAARARKIIVGYDGSDASTRALDAAADLVGYGSTLAVVTVQDGHSPRSVTSAAREQLHGRLVQAGYHEATGEPATQLVEKARELEADLIVIGRGDGWPLLGAVSSNVLARAGCDVLVVR
jgi:nucleotide-binding universal stress UspA family protein